MNMKENFEETYSEQLRQDINELKNIGTLEYNFKNIMREVNDTRMAEFQDLMQYVIKAINDDQNVYQKDEITKKMLLEQINNLKQRTKIEIN